jgi:hypothetical protein
MGQEASVPLDGEEQSLEEQARAPPSSAVVAPLSPRSSGAKRKGGMHLSGLFPSSSLTRKEAAAAMNPDHILGDESQSSSQRHLDALQRIPVSHEANGDASFTQHHQYPPEHSSAPAETPNTTTPTKKLLSGRARGMISSMRHLSLGITSRKPKEPNNTDWEKQWDDDEDDSEDDEEGEPNQATLVPTTTGPLHATLPPMPLTAVAEDDDDDETVRHVIPPEEAGLEIPPELQKPDVQMFMPVLRVLGKGSFGKVRINLYLLIIPLHVISSHSNT